MNSISNIVLTWMSCSLLQGPDMRRLRTLAAFQLKVLLHALSFPSVERVAYSTCSVYQEVCMCVYVCACVCGVCVCVWCML